MKLPAWCARVAGVLVVAGIAATGFALAAPRASAAITTPPIVPGIDPVQTKEAGVRVDVGAITAPATTPQNVESAANSGPTLLQVPSGISHPALQPIDQPTEPRQQLKKQIEQNYWSRYVILDISDQRLYLIESEHTVDSWLVSTGLPQTPTNLGTFRVFSRIERERMTGPGYDLYPVMYTQYFNAEGEALHGAYWHSNWGQRMSHGCVNMSNERAKQLWFWSPPRMKVVIRP